MDDVGVADQEEAVGRRRRPCARPRRSAGRAGSRGPSRRIRRPPAGVSASSATKFASLPVTLARPIACEASRSHGRGRCDRAAAAKPSGATNSCRESEAAHPVDRRQRQKPRRGEGRREKGVVDIVDADRERAGDAGAIAERAQPRSGPASCISKARCSRTASTNSARPPMLPPSTTICGSTVGDNRQRRRAPEAAPSRRSPAARRASSASRSKRSRTVNAGVTAGLGVAAR